MAVLPTSNNAEVWAEARATAKPLLAASKVSRDATLAAFEAGKPAYGVPAAVAAPATGGSST